MTQARRALATTCALACAALACGCERRASDDARLARLERRVDKIVAVLERAMPPQEPDPAAVYAVPLAAEDPVDGPPEALLTLVEGFELACPYCYAAQEILRELRARHPGELRIVSKYFLVHGQLAVPAGLAACAAARQGKFAPLRQALWRKIFPDGPAKDAAQASAPALAAEQLTEPAVLATAAETGLDLPRLRADMASEACRRWVTAGAAELAPLGARGTPAFYLNGRALAQLDLESIAPLLEEELAKARREVARGVPPGDYYRTAVSSRGLTRVASPFAD